MRIAEPMLLTAAVLLAVPAAAPAQPVFPGEAWQTRTPEQAGMDSAALDQFVARVGGVGCIVRDGYMVRTWGDQTSKADWASVAKPVHATMLFFAIDEGLVPDIDTPIAQWGWAMRPDDEHLTFRHLANMTSGYARAEAPGQRWAYNDIAVKLFAVTLFDRVFQATPDDAARAPHRLGPLRFQDGTIFSSRDGYGLSTTPRDAARIGWLWLNRGHWDGEQLIPASFFDAHMTAAVPGDLPRTTAPDADYLGVGTMGGGTDQTPYGPGIYGSFWWFNGDVGTTGSRAWPDAPADTVLALGHWNEEVMILIPSLRIVAAARGQWGAFAPGDPAAGMNTTLALLAAAVLPDCRADFDGDGDLTLDDFVQFRNAYVAGDPAADFDGSGTLTLNDFIAYRNAYAAGCG